MLEELKYGDKIVTVNDLTKWDYDFPCTSYVEFPAGSPGYIIGFDNVAGEHIYEVVLQGKSPKRLLMGRTAIKKRPDMYLNHTPELLSGFSKMYAALVDIAEEYYKIMNRELGYPHEVAIVSCDYESFTAECYGEFGDATYTIPYAFVSDCCWHGKLRDQIIQEKKEAIAAGIRQEQIRLRLLEIEEHALYMRLKNKFEKNEDSKIGD